MYGLTLLVAILACIWLTTRCAGRATRRRLRSRAPRRRVGRRLRRRRRAPLPRPHLVERGAVARSGRAIFEVWQGGLGVWGGILFGTLAGVDRRPPLGRQRSPRSWTRPRPGSCSRRGSAGIGNWWNQELFGKPTDAAVGARDRPGAPAAPVPRPSATFHPTFLYELIWDLAGVALLLWRRRGASRSGRRRCSRSTSPTTASAASSRSSCGSTRRTTSPGCA